MPIWAMWPAVFAARTAGGRQKDFVDTEKSLGRTDPAQISALVGYAGGQVGRPSTLTGSQAGVGQTPSGILPDARHDRPGLQRALLVHALSP